MLTLRGIPVSPGVVIGKVFVLDEEHRRIPKRLVPAEQTGNEVARLEGALGKSVAELTAVREQAERELGPDAAKIFMFHIGMLMDRTLTGPMREAIQKERVTAEYAVYSGFSAWSDRLRSMTSSVIATKVDDVRDLSSRVLKHLIGEHTSKLADLDHEAVVIARDLTPSQTAAFDRSKVMSFATDLGGRTSHTAIFARALGIPAVVGCQTITQAATDGTPIIVDGDHGVVILEPTKEQLEHYRAYVEQRRLFQLSLTDLSSLPSVTRDGTHVELLGNIEFAEEIPLVLDCGGEGVGLYRTEFLFITNNSEPTEEDHFQSYRKCVELLQGKPLTIRTVDLGADKYTQERTEIPERNPFLGLRSIRYCLQRIPMFRVQLRAILRASAYGPVKIMFPLVTTMGELRQAKWLVRDVMEDLSEEGVKFDPHVPIGIMVEVPSAAIMADQFARECEFFSIGTNDLVQYTLAVDRINERVANLYNPSNPAVITLIRNVVRVARRRKIPVSCCGEAAGDLDYAVLLIGLGVRTLSTTSSSIPQLKRLVRSVTVEQCERIARKALSFDSDIEVAAYLRDESRKIIPEAFDARSVAEPV